MRENKTLKDPLNAGETWSLARLLAFFFNTAPFGFFGLGLVKKKRD